MLTPRTIEEKLTRPVLSRREVGQQLGVSPATVDRLLSSGALPKLKVGSRCLVRRIDLERFIDQGGTYTAQSDVTSGDANETGLNVDEGAAS